MADVMTRITARGFTSARATSKAPATPATAAVHMTSSSPTRWGACGGGVCPAEWWDPCSPSTGTSWCSGALWSPMLGPRTEVAEGVKEEAPPLPVVWLKTKAVQHGQVTALIWPHIAWHTNTKLYTATVSRIYLMYNNFSKMVWEKKRQQQYQCGGDVLTNWESSKEKGIPTCHLSCLVKCGLLSWLRLQQQIKVTCFFFFKSKHYI